MRLNSSEPIYLDHHSATKPCKSALERMKPYLEERWGASFSPHAMGREQIHALDGRLQMIYDLAGADSKDRFFFASSGAHAVQQVLMSVFLEVSRKEGKCHFAVSSFEDAPLMMGLKRLESLGCFVKVAGCTKEGVVDLNELEAAINPRTALVSISLAQGLTGVVQPIEEIAALCRSKQVLLHVDATYAVGKMPLEMHGDYLTFAGDRMHGVKSSAALFAKPASPLVPLLVGDTSIDTPSLLALSAASQQSMLAQDLMGLETVRLRDRLEEGLMSAIPGALPLFREALRLPNVSVMVIPGVHQEALLYALNRKQIYASVGGGPHQHLGRLLTAAKVDDKAAESAIHFSLSRYTHSAEIEAAIERMVGAARQLQELSREL